MATLIAFNDRREFKVDHDLEEVARIVNAAGPGLVQLVLAPRSGGLPAAVWVNPSQIAFMVDARENV